MDKCEKVKQIVGDLIMKTKKKGGSNSYKRLENQMGRIIYVFKADNHK